MTAQRLSGEQGFRIGARQVPLCSKAGLREPGVQMALQEARRLGNPIHCLFCGGENVRLGTYYLNEKGIFFLRKAPGRSSHLAGCLLEIYAGVTEPDSVRRVLAGVFDEERRRERRPEEDDAIIGGELDVDRVAPIRGFGAFAGSLFARAYYAASGTHLLWGSPGASAGAPPRNPGSIELCFLNAFRNELLSAEISSDSAPMAYLNELAERGHEPVWGIADDVVWEAGERDDLVRITDPWREAGLQMAISKGQRICGRLTTYGRRIGGPYFYFATGRLTEWGPKAVNVFVHPVALAGGQLCPVDSSCERDWLAFAVANGWGWVKILSNKSLLPWISSVPATVRSHLRKGLSYRWRPDFLCERSGELAVIEVAGMLGDAGYANNLREKLALWHPLARAGGFRHETYAPRGSGFGLVLSSEGRAESAFKLQPDSVSHLSANQ